MVASVSEKTCSMKELAKEAEWLSAAIKVRETDLLGKSLTAEEMTRIRLNILWLKENYHLIQKAFLETYWKERQPSCDASVRQRHRQTLGYHHVRAQNYYQQRISMDVEATAN